MTSEKPSIAELLTKVEFGLSLAEADHVLTPTEVTSVLSYLTQLHYLGEKAYCRRIREDLDMGAFVSTILGRLEKVRWIKGKYEKVDGRRVKVYHPTSRGEDILEKCELPPYG